MWNKEYAKFSREGRVCWRKTRREEDRLCCPWQKCDQKSGHTGSGGNRASVTDLSSEIDENFFRRAVLVGDSDQDTLSVLRRDRRQREHMAPDDVFFDRCDIEITLGIFAGDLRVMETVKFLQFDLMPVVKEIVVKKSAANELLLLEAEGKDHRQEKSGFGHGDTMVIAGASPMLFILF